jgi:membrane fusion protein
MNELRTDLNIDSKIAALIQDLISSAYKDSSFCFLFGSYAKGTQTEVSDIDLIIVYEKAVQPLHEKTKFREKYFDIFIFDIESLNFVLHNARMTRAAISDQVILREHSLRDELNKTRQLQHGERNALLKKIDGLQAELQKLGTQIDAQQARVKLAEDALARYQDLVAKNYVSAETLQQKQADLLDQKLRLESLGRDRISVGRDLASQQGDLTALPLKHQNQLAEIERAIAATGQELTESEAKRGLVMTAPESGIATAALADVGQAVDTSKPLVSIVPKDARLQAHLYAPSKAIGFVKPGDPVLLRYQAYPYQKFGHAKGTVASVSRTALPASEFASLMNNSQATGAEPLYRITVDLAMQTVSAYGKQQPLQAGMLLDADVLQETRHLYEWVLEPLYSLTGKL